MLDLELIIFFFFLVELIIYIFITDESFLLIFYLDGEPTSQYHSITTCGYKDF